MLEGFHLPDKLGDISSDGRSQDFHRLDDTIGINDKAAPDIDSSVFVIDPIHSSDSATLV
jgi:hypothetical protein